MTTPYLAPSLLNLGYIGVTATTPYTNSSAAQTATLQNQYASALAGQVIAAAPVGTIHLNINFDGTKNNKAYAADGESKTNIGNIYDLQVVGALEKNTIYMTGIGAQTVPSNTLLPNGSPDPKASPSNLDSIPSNAGTIGNAILEEAYRRLTTRVNDLLAENPNAQITLNLAGFSRGGAEAVAFANLLNELGIPGLYAPGSVPINTMVLFEPVSETDGQLNVRWPTNLVNPALVFVATAENRLFFLAMPTGANAIIVPIEAVHSDIGGSFNPDGISAVTLKIARDYLDAGGSALGQIPPELQPNWDRMYIHNSAIDNFGNLKFDTIGNPFQTVGTNRYYEGSGLGSITVNDALGREFKVTPIYEDRNGRLVLAGFNRKTSSNTTDPTTGSTTDTNDITVYARDGRTIIGRSFTSATTDSTGQLTDRLIVTYAIDGATIRSTSVTELLPNNNLLTTNRDGQGGTVSIAELQRLDDGTSLQTTTYPNGKVEVLATDSNSQRSSLDVITPTEGGGQFVETYTYINGIKTHQSSKSIDYDYSEAGIIRTEVVSTASGSVRNVYNESDTLLLSEALPSAGPSNLELSNAANVVTDLINFSKTLASNAPGLYKLGSGIVLLNNHLNPGGNTTAFPNFGTAATIAGGALSLYNLGQAFSSSGNELGQFSAVANGLNFLNNNFIGNASLAGALNGTAGTVFNTARDGLVSSGQFGIVGGTVGVLPALGLVSSIKSGDPLGIAQSAIALFNPALLFTSGVGFTPLGWFFIGATILQTMFAPGPPKAWGVANVTYGEGIDNLGLQVNASGDSFGTERAQAGLQNIVDYLQSEVIDSYNASHDASSHVGLIAQRLPGLAWRASDAGDPGFKLTDIDPLTGEQKFPYRRFDDEGLPYSSNEAAYQVDPSDPNQRGGMGQALVMSAYNRQAIAPLWEVRTAKMQGDAGAVNAGLSEEERAAKAGLSAALDTAYAAAHPNDASASNKRLGSFMAVAMDLNGDNRITTSTIAQNVATGSAGTGGNGQSITFNWDDQSYQKKVGWVGDGTASTDGFLVLDRDFNQSVDNGTELFSNPLVADPAKGLRSLATWDADGDGRITAADPIYHQLKVWQDFDQDGNNTHGLTVTDATGSHTVIVQDETSFNGSASATQELRSLASLGIVAIDYANGRYEFASATSPNGVDYRQISTIKLEAEPEGVRYTPVGAGIKIDTSGGSPQIVITQVQSEAAAYAQGEADLNANRPLATAGETVGTDAAPLYEDGVHEAWRPPVNGYSGTLTLPQVPAEIPDSRSIIVKTIATYAHLGKDWGQILPVIRSAANDISWRVVA